MAAARNTVNNSWAVFAFRDVAPLAIGGVEMAGQKAFSRFAQGSVRYGATDLSRKAGRFRMKNRIEKQNIAVLEYRAADGTLKAKTMSSFTRKKGGKHSERLVWDKLKKMGVKRSQLHRIYSEFEPCSIPTRAAGCARFIEDNFPNARVTFSFEYGLTQASRDAGRAARLAVSPHTADHIYSSNVDEILILANWLSSAAR